MTAATAIRHGFAWLFRRTAPEVTMPTTVARPDWRAVAGSRDWTPVCDEPCSITRTYTDARHVRVAVHMPGGAYVTVHHRRADGSAGRWIESYWVPEREEDWPATKRLIEAVS